MIATWDEWLLFLVTCGCLFRVIALFRRVSMTRRWAKSPGGIMETSSRQRNLIKDHFEQERIRLYVACLYFSAGLAAVITAPPPPRISLQARWKLWVIICAAALLWRQSERAWVMLTRRTQVEKVLNGSAVVSRTSPVGEPEVRS